MIILVADTSVLIELEHAQLLELAFQGPDSFVTPDFLYERELANDIGPQLLALGLKILALTADEMSTAQTLTNTNTTLSLPDCAAYVGARRPNHHLLTGDGALRRLAAAEGLTHHGVLWIMDRMLETQTATMQQLHAGLAALAQHPRCRLPPHEVERRLNEWRP
jgi:hypothetical protein